MGNSWETVHTPALTGLLRPTSKNSWANNSRISFVTQFFLVFPRCSKYYRLGGVGSSTTVRKCQENGEWTTRRSSFGCSLECGIGGSETTGLVTGGVASKRGKWPWHVALFHEDPPNSGKWDLKCGGSLITPQAILTAAHCTTKKFTESPLPNRELTVGLGRFYRSFTRQENGGQTRKVRHIEIHPEYNQNTLESDIAIIFLDTVCHASYNSGVDKVIFNLLCILIAGHHNGLCETGLLSG